MSDIADRLRTEAASGDIAYRTVTVLMDGALEIEQLRAKITKADYLLNQGGRINIYSASEFFIGGVRFPPGHYELKRLGDHETKDTDFSVKDF